jgi:hypothetical protein
VFTEEGLDLAFWFTFAGYRNTVSADPRHDLDLASYGLVSMLSEGPGRGYQGLGRRPRLAVGQNLVDGLGSALMMDSW